MSTKEQIKRIVDLFKVEPNLKDKTDGMAEGLLLGGQLADESNERSKETENKLKQLQREYTENGNGSQTTAEISLARDGEQVLADRLKRDHDEVTAQLAQKVGTGTKAELEDLSGAVLAAIEGGEGTTFNLLSIPQNDSVTEEKLHPSIRSNLMAVLNAIKVEGQSWEVNQ